MPERPDVGAERAIAAAAGLSGEVALRVVGPDGGPLDEPDAPSGTLTLTEAVRRAVTTDPGLQAALARVQLAVAEADRARLLPNPVLDVVVRAGSGAPRIEASFVASFVQALQRPARASAADHRLRAGAADAVVAALDVISEVQERYIAAQASAALLPLLEERFALVERLVATARARLDAGEGTRADVVTLDAQRVELQVAIDRARLDEQTDRLRLARSIGTPSALADWQLEPWRPPAIGLAPELAWVEAALARRPEIQAIAWRLAALGDEESLADLLPWEGASVGVAAESDDGWRFGPAVSTPVPLFDGGGARRAAATAAQLEARHELLQQKRRVVAEVRTAFQALAASTVNLARIEHELVPLERQRRQLVEDAYRAGLIDVTPLFLAEQDLRVAQTQAIEVQAQAAAALVRLQRAVGGPGVAARLAAGPPSEAAHAAEPIPGSDPLHPAPR
jgi:cobalt-zinc-cadmium efflux system outer membrane protein